MFAEMGPFVFLISFREKKIMSIGGPKYLGVGSDGIRLRMLIIYEH